MSIINKNNEIKTEEAKTTKSKIDGQIIRLRIPDLTEDRRKDLIKILKKV